MDFVSDLGRYLLWGFLGLVGLVVVFGKRVETNWDYEAKFRDARGRELGEFDVELRRIPKDHSDWRLKARFHLRHPALEIGKLVEVYLEDVRVFEKTLEKAGRVYLTEVDLCGEIKSPAAGQVVSVRCSGEELFSEALYRD